MGEDEVQLPLIVRNRMPSRLAREVVVFKRVVWQIQGARRCRERSGEAGEGGERGANSSLNAIDGGRGEKKFTPSAYDD